MADPLLIVHNQHVPGCGEPSRVTSGDGDLYIGYFENPFGEQWVFTYDRQSRRAVLRGGDAGWETEFEVIDGGVAGLVLGEEELTWLRACWSAATGSSGGV